MSVLLWGQWVRGGGHRVLEAGHMGVGSKDRERKGVKRSQGSRWGPGREKVVGVRCSREGAGKVGGVLGAWA